MITKRKRKVVAGVTEIFTCLSRRDLTAQARREREAMAVIRRCLLGAKKSRVKGRKNKGTRKAVKGRVIFKMKLERLSKLCFMLCYVLKLLGRLDVKR